MDVVLVFNLPMALHVRSYYRMTSTLRMFIPCMGGSWFPDFEGGGDIVCERGCAQDQYVWYDNAVYCDDDVITTTNTTLGT